jgi:hypothetical protein
LELAIVLDEQGQILDSSGARVVDWGVLLAGCVELDGGEALNVIGYVVGSGIDLGDDDFVGEGLEELAEFVVLGGEGFAVAAPWGVDCEGWVRWGICMKCKENLHSTRTSLVSSRTISL